MQRKLFTNSDGRSKFFFFLSKLGALGGEFWPVELDPKDPNAPLTGRRLFRFEAMKRFLEQKPRPLTCGRRYEIVHGTLYRRDRTLREMPGRQRRNFRKTRGIPTVALGAQGE